MPETDFEFRGSNLSVGIELEYPRVKGGERMVSRGRYSNTVRQRIDPSGGPDFNPVYDGTVGSEFVSPVIDVDQAPGWYKDTLDYISSQGPWSYQPVGLMNNGNTAGLHIHISPLSESEARDLYEISQTEWAKVFFCSSIANTESSATWPVFRGGQHCAMRFNGDRYTCVNQRGPDHWEWRMPEPAYRKHMELIAKFLDIFKAGGREAAVEYAQERLDDGDDRITSIRRAEKAGMGVGEIPVIDQSPPDTPEAEAFFDEVRDYWSIEPYRVGINGEEFVLVTGEADRGRYEFEAGTDTFSVAPSEVRRADMTRVNDASLVRAVVESFQRGNTEQIRETDATKELKEIVKKKKE